MNEFLGNASSTELQCLLAFPFVGMIGLFGLLFYFNQRDKAKAENKLGQPAKKRATPPIQQPTAEEELDVSVLSSFRQPARAQAKPVPTELRPTVVPPKQPSLPAPTTPPPSVVPIDEAVELLRLLRDPDGSLIVEIAGRRFTSLQAITDKRVGYYILELTGHLLAFTNGMVVTQKGVVSHNRPNVGKLPQPPVEPPTPEPIVEPAPTPSAEPLPQIEPRRRLNKSDYVNEELPSVKPNPLLGNGFLGFGKQPTEPLLAGFSLAKQINNIVQNRLQNSPLANRYEIELSTAPSGGIQFEVNGRRFDSVDSIPDPKIQALINASIKEWERS